MKNKIVQTIRIIISRILIDFIFGFNVSNRNDELFV